MKQNKKGFTIIELIAVLGILVLLAVIKLSGYTEQAKLAQIKNDVKSYEVAMSLELSKNSKFIENWVPISQNELDEMNSSGKLINKRGKSPSDLQADSFIKLKISMLSINMPPFLNSLY